MKNRILICALIFLIGLCKSHGQHYEMKKQLSTDDKEELLNLSGELFKLNPFYRFNISTEQVELPNSISKGRKQKADIDRLENLLSKDSLNSITLFQIGSYYSDTGNDAWANIYFNKSFQNLSYNQFEGDSSVFYSVRGMLKFKLNYEDPISDFEKSLKINPNDSLAINLYPLVLMANGQLSDARNYCINLLDQKDITNCMPFIYLITTEMLETLGFLSKEITGDSIRSKEYRAKDYKDIFNFKLIDKYFEKLGNFEEIKNARVMADIFALYIKMLLFDQGQNGETILDYTPNDILKLEELNNWLLDASAKKRMKEYTAYKNLGFVNHLLDKQDAAINYFNKSIDVFPPSELCTEFNPYESFDALLVIYYYNNDTTKYRETIQKKISFKPTFAKSAVDYRNLAFYFFSVRQPGKAMEWCQKALVADEKDGENIRLLAHLYYLKGMSSISQIYFGDLVKLITTPQLGYEFSLQLAIYQLLNNNSKDAYMNIKLAREAYSAAFPKKPNCEICDKLVNNYINIAE